MLVENSFYSDIKPLIIIDEPPFSEGRATVYSLEEGKEIEITIKTIFNKYKFITAFEAYIQVNGEEIKLGECETVFIKKLDNGKFENNPPIDHSFCPYGKRKIEKAGKIFVWNIQSYKNKEYKGVGTALMQAAMEYGYSKNCNGYIDLSAIQDSPVFYYKLGMRTTDIKMDNRILKRIQKYEGKPIPFKNFGGFTMYMPKNGRKLWKQRINTNSIFKETMQYLNP